MALVLLHRQRWTPGGHGLLEALPRIYQVTPEVPDRRRATKQKEVRPSPADSLKESQLAARSGPSPPRRTSPTAGMRTASLQAVAPPLVVAGRTVCVWKEVLRGQPRRTHIDDSQIDFDSAQIRRRSRRHDRFKPLLALVRIDSADSP